MRPITILWTVCADLLFINWLKQQGIDYDIITDDLLDKDDFKLFAGYDESAGILSSLGQRNDNGPGSPDK